MRRRIIPPRKPPFVNRPSRRPGPLFSQRFPGFSSIPAARGPALDSLFRPLYSRPIIKGKGLSIPAKNGDLTTKKTSPMMLQSLTT